MAVAGAAAPPVVPPFCPAQPVVGAASNVASIGVGVGVGVGVNSGPTAHFLASPELGSLPKLAVAHRTSPDRVAITHLSLMPYDTCLLLAPALQVPPSSAHFEYPLGQSAADAAPQHNSATAPKMMVSFIATSQSP